MKKSKHGAGLAFLRDHVDHQGNDCLIWPFGRYTNGYGSVRFGGKSRPASRVMCLLAHGEPKASEEDDAAHSCGNGHLGCVNPNHLSWKTRAGNLEDRRKHGTLPIGSAHGSAKLTAESVRAIRSDYKAAAGSHAQLAERYGVGATAIGRIVRRERWGHIQ